MKKWLLDKLVCPECGTRQAKLTLEIQEEEASDIQEGQLQCQICRKRYPIHQGVAVLLPHKSMSVLLEESGYNSRGMLSSYMWSHYGDLLDDPRATDAYQKWSTHVAGPGDTALDIGCAVGRLSFELTKSHTQVIGIDNSLSFIRKAREMMNREQIEFDMVIEGDIMETQGFAFQNGWDKERVEFLVADAMALPFDRETFTTAASINILEKVPNPTRHLAEINRVLKVEGGRFLFSDPFSWDKDFVDPDLWLSGKAEGKYACRGIETMQRLFQGEDNVFDPPLQVKAMEDIAWKIRKTENLWEHITSQLIVGTR